MKKPSFLFYAYNYQPVRTASMDKNDRCLDRFGSEKDCRSKCKSSKPISINTAGTEPNSMYITCICRNTYQLQQYEKTIQFGEKHCPTRDRDQYKLRLYLFWPMPQPDKKGPGQGYSYTEQIIELADKMRNSTENNSLSTTTSPPGLRIQVQLLQPSPRTSERHEASTRRWTYQLDKSDKSANFVRP